MLTNRQITFYRDNGYLLVSDIFTETELERMEAAFDSIVERRLRCGAHLDSTWKGKWKERMPQTTILHTHDLQAYCAQWSRVLLHDRFTEALSDLIGPNVQLHHTKLFQKPPEKGSAFPMHQDHPYFPHENHSMMASVIHLTDATEEMGCIRIVPGSHKLGPLTPHENRYLDPAEYPIEKATTCPAKRGDVLIFSYLTIHGSGINTSDRTRKTVLVQIRDPEDKPADESHHSHAQGLMMRGIHPLTDGSLGAPGTRGG